MSDRDRSAEGLSHLDARGRAHMVDVGEKPVTLRVCVARGAVRMQAATLAAISGGRVPKGDVLTTARLAGIQAAKRTAEWIPLAHPLPLDQVDVEARPDPETSRVLLEATARVHARTGVEMEAMVAVAAAALTVIDMCKAIDRSMTMEGVRVVFKAGGRSGLWTRPGEALEVGDG